MGCGVALTAAIVTSVAAGAPPATAAESDASAVSTARAAPTTAPRQRVPTPSPSTTRGPSPTTIATPTSAKPKPKPTPKAKAPPRRVRPANGATSTDGRDGAGIVIGISDALATVAVTSAEHDLLVASRDALAESLSSTNLRIISTTARSAELAALNEALVGLRDRTTARLTKLRSHSVTLARSIRNVAVQQYVSGAEENLYPDPNATIEEQLVRSRRSTITNRGITRAITAKISVDATMATESRNLTDLDAALAKEQRDAADNTGEHDASIAEANRLIVSLIDAEQSVRNARANAIVQGSDLPLAALDAYWRAAIRIRSARPTCGIEWWALAGIGRTESNHGRAAGGILMFGGDISVPVYGISLDGTNGTQAIADSDGGMIDGDATIDRAVGVMQFIPGTWRRYGADGSGDGRSDPQNMYDAALSAANYLCGFGPGLDTAVGLRRAYYGYNHSKAYVELVLSRSVAYRSLAVVPGAPTGPLYDPGPEPTPPVSTTSPSPTTTAPTRPTTTKPTTTKPTTTKPTTTKPPVTKSSPTTAATR